MNYLKIIVALAFATCLVVGFSGCKGEEAAAGAAPATGAGGHAGSQANTAEGPSVAGGGGGPGTAQATTQ